MKNKLTDLNDHLFAQLERLSDEDLKGEALTRELERSKAITSVAREVVANGKLLLDAQIALGDHGVRSLPPMLAHESNGTTLPALDKKINGRAQ